MPVFTERLGDLIEDGFEVGLTDYPIFDDDYRTKLNTKILDHYTNCEIGFETPGQFRFALNRKMREIMPYYNQLYESTKIEFDPLSTMDYTDDTTSTNEVNSSQNSNSTNSNATASRARAVNSELPQVHLSPDEDYATSAADSNSETNTSGEGVTATTGTDSGSGSVAHVTKGRQGPAASLLMNYRNSLLNIDMLVIAELESLFMGIWNTHDSYTSSGRGIGNGYATGYIGSV